MMNRLLWGAPPPPVATLPEQIAEIEQEIAKVEAELQPINKKLAAYRAAKVANAKDKNQLQAIDKAALPLLREKARLEEQLKTLRSRRANLQQLQHSTASVKSSAATVAVIKSAVADYNAQASVVALSDVQNTLELLRMCVENANEVEQLFSRSFSTPRQETDAELIASMDALGAELEFDVPEPVEVPVDLTQIAALKVPSAKLPSTATAAAAAATAEKPVSEVTQ